jgi:hypothetical protein
MKLNESPFHTSYRSPYGTKSSVSDVFVQPTVYEFKEIEKELVDTARQSIGFIIFKGKFYIFPYNKMHDELARIAGMSKHANVGTWDLNLNVPHGVFFRERSYINDEWSDWKIEKLQGPRVNLTRLWLKPFLNEVNGKGSKFVRNVKSYIKIQKNALKNKFSGSKYSDSYQHLFAAPTTVKPRVLKSKKKITTNKKLVVKKTLPKPPKTIKKAMTASKKRIATAKKVLKK